MSRIDADERLRSFVERAERLNAEIDAMNADKREVFAEARAIGYDVKALKAVIGIRKKRAADPDALQEHEHMVALYLASLDKPNETGHARTPAPARDEPADETESPSLSAPEEATCLPPQAGQMIRPSGVLADETEGDGLAGGGDGAAVATPSNDDLSIPDFMLRDANNRAPFMEGAD